MVCISGVSRPTSTCTDINEGLRLVQIVYWRNRVNGLDNIKTTTGGDCSQYLNKRERRERREKERNV